MRKRTYRKSKNRTEKNDDKEDNKILGFLMESWGVSRTLLLAAIALLLVGCVSQKEYNALKTEKQELEDKMAELKVNEEMEDYVQSNKLYGKSTTLYNKNKELTRKEKKLDSLENIINSQQAELKKALAVVNKLSQKDWYIDELDGKLKIDLHTSILFPVDSDTLSTEGIQMLAQLASDIKSLKRIESIKVVGHTDNQKFENETYDNWELSADRALKVTKVLQLNGIDPSKLSAEAKSFYAPKMTNDTAYGREANRRVEIEIIPKVNYAQLINQMLASK